MQKHTLRRGAIRKKSRVPALPDKSRDSAELGLERMRSMIAAYVVLAITFMSYCIVTLNILMQENYKRQYQIRESYEQATKRLERIQSYVKAGPQLLENAVCEYVYPKWPGRYMKPGVQEQCKRFGELAISYANNTAGAESVRDAFTRAVKESINDIEMRKVLLGKVQKRERGNPPSGYTYDDYWDCNLWPKGVLLRQLTNVYLDAKSGKWGEQKNQVVAWITMGTELLVHPCGGAGELAPESDGPQGRYLSRSRSIPKLDSVIVFAEMRDYGLEENPNALLERLKDEWRDDLRKYTQNQNLPGVQVPRVGTELDLEVASILSGVVVTALSCIFFLTRLEGKRADQKRRFTGGSSFPQFRAPNDPLSCQVPFWNLKEMVNRLSVASIFARGCWLSFLVMPTMLVGLGVSSRYLVFTRSSETNFYVRIVSRSTDTLSATIDLINVALLVICVCIVQVICMADHVGSNNKNSDSSLIARFRQIVGVIVIPAIALFTINVLGENWYVGAEGISISFGETEYGGNSTLRCIPFVAAMVTASWLIISWVSRGRPTPLLLGAILFSEAILPYTQPIRVATSIY